MSRVGDLSGRLYRGEIAVDFVGRRKLWYAISIVLLVISAVGVGVRGLHFGVEFTGGSVFSFQTAEASRFEVAQTVESVNGVEDASVREVSGNRWQVETESLVPQELTAVQSAIADKYGLEDRAVSPQSIGPTWGGQISRQAGIGLAVFLALVILYLSIVFEWKMAVGAIIALLHDVALTVGIYAIIGFQVSPATAIGLLTILGFSLYDTVVVFDKVRENSSGLAGGSRMTLSQAANLAVNQVLIRSINTSIVALLPMGAILFVGAGLLGAGVLKDLSLVLFIGTIAGVYSSVFIATPLFAQIKEREPQMQALARRVAARQGGGKGDSKRRKGAQAGSDADTASTEGTVGAEENGPGSAARTPAGVGVGQQIRVFEEQDRQQPRKTGSKRRPSGKKRR